MKKQFQDLLKGIFLSSISSIIATQNVDASNISLQNVSEPDNKKSEVTPPRDNSLKYILTFKSDNSYLLATHRSHRSHQSHRSHRSSATYTGGSTYSSPSSSYSPSSGTNGSYYSNGVIHIGDRLLKKNMVGNDVSELRRILVDKKMLAEKPDSNSLLFDEDVEAAVIAFQKSAGLKPDGLVGKQTVQLLKK